MNNESFFPDQFLCPFCDNTLCIQIYNFDKIEKKDIVNGQYILTAENHPNILHESNLPNSYYENNDFNILISTNKIIFNVNNSNMKNIYMYLLCKSCHFFKIPDIVSNNKNNIHELDLITSSSNYFIDNKTIKIKKDKFYVGNFYGNINILPKPFHISNKHNIIKKIKNLLLLS